MNNEQTELKHRLDFLHARLASYPTGGRPSYVSADIAFDRVAIEAINKRLVELDQAV